MSSSFFVLKTVKVKLEEATPLSIERGKWRYRPNQGVSGLREASDSPDLPAPRQRGRHADKTGGNPTLHNAQSKRIATELRCQTPTLMCIDEHSVALQQK